MNETTLTCLSLTSNSDTPLGITSGSSLLIIPSYKSPCPYRRATLDSTGYSISFLYSILQNHQRQECIPVGCVPPACCPYLPACTAPGERVYLPRGGVYLFSGVYLPRGCTCLGGVPVGGGGPAWGCTCPGGCT